MLKILYLSRFHAGNTAKSFCVTIPEALLVLRFKIHASALSYISSGF